MPEPNPVFTESSSLDADRGWDPGEGGVASGDRREQLMAARRRRGPALKTRSRLSLHQGTDHGAGVQAAQVVVSLPRAHKHDGLTCDVSHGDGSADLQEGGAEGGRLESRDASFRNILTWEKE